MIYSIPQIGILVFCTGCFVKLSIPKGSFVGNLLSVCLSVLRDISERGRDLESILAQYINFVKPAFEEFCLPVSVHSAPAVCIL